MVRSTSRIASLDGLRGIACTLVLIGHFNSPETWSLYRVQLFFIVHTSASQAVMLFFSLSAFLLSYLASIEYQRKGEFSARRFIGRRALRIWPLVYCAIAFEMLVVIPPWGIFPLNNPARVAWIWSHAWMYAAFVSNWSISVNFLWHLDVSTPTLAVLWTVAVEEQFYLVFPFVFLLFNRSDARNRLVLVLSICAFALAWRVTIFSIAYLNGDTNRSVDPIYYSTFSYLDVLVMAVAAGWIAASQSYEPIKSLLRRERSGWVVAGLLLLSVLAWKYGYHLPHVGKTVLYPLSISIIAFAFSVTILWLFLNGDSVASRVLSNPRLRTIGLLSFGIYVWHSTAGEILNVLINANRWVPGARFDLLWALRFFAFFSYSVVLALLSYRFIEQPALNLRRRLYAEGRDDRFLDFNFSKWLTGSIAVSALLTVGASAIQWIF